MIQQRNQQLTHLLEESKAMTVVPRYLRSYAVGRGLTPQDAEDAFAYALEMSVSKGRWENASHFSKWLYSTAKHYLCNDWRRGEDNTKMLGYWKVDGKSFHLKSEATKYAKRVGCQAKWVASEKQSTILLEDVSDQGVEIDSGTAFTGSIASPFRASSIIEVDPSKPKPNSGRGKLVYEFLLQTGKIETHIARGKVEQVLAQNGFSKRFVWQNFEQFLIRTI